MKLVWLWSADDCWTFREVLPDLLADGQLREAAALGRRPDLERVHAERVCRFDFAISSAIARSPAALHRLRSEICCPLQAG